MSRRGKPINYDRKLGTVPVFSDIFSYSVTMIGLRRVGGLADGSHGPVLYIVFSDTKPEITICKPGSGRPE